MVTTDYLAFGYKITKIELNPGDSTRTNTKKYTVGDWYMIDSVYNPNLTKEDYSSGNFTFNEISLHISGKVAITPVHTMIPEYYTRGHCTVDRTFVMGMVKEAVVEPTIIFNIHPFANLEMTPVLPNVTVLRWSAGDIVDPPVRFFLADGSFKKGSNIYSTPGAYTLTTGNVEVTADCLGFIFNS